MGKSPGTKEAQSQMAAAEEERIALSASNPVKSLLEPAISITSPTGEKVSSKKATVHPANAYDQPASGISSAASSEPDDMADITKARKLALNISKLDQTVPDRIVRVILRGDWNLMQQEADEGRRRQRTYLVATDLSDEAVYALEWTIGTILRDGDTLLAIYAIEQEVTSGEKTSGETERDALHAEGGRAAQDTERAMESLTEKTQAGGSATVKMLSPSGGFVPVTETDSITGSVDSRRVSRAQMERLRAVENISHTCVRLLRKTRLQVRVTVEVIHCKSPKHLITGAIDELEPTLVILGSRGRSALKGVLLGSFSNYLVTKSSVPVMVARKKLKKHSKMKGTYVRLTNNLQTPNSPTVRRSLAEANPEVNRAKRRF